MESLVQLSTVLTLLTLPIMPMKSEAQDTYNFYFQKEKGPQTVIQGQAPQSDMTKSLDELENEIGLEVKENSKTLNDKEIVDKDHGQKEETSIVQNEDDPMKGLQLAFFFPTYFASRWKLEGPSSRQSFDERVDMEGSLGIGVGYTYFAPRSWGASTQISYMSGLRARGEAFEEESFSLIRAELNGGYAINRYFQFQGGVNISKYIGSRELDNAKPMIGGQFGVSSQITTDIGLNVKYVTMLQKYSRFPYGELRTRHEGIEAGITFLL